MVIKRKRSDSEISTSSSLLSSPPSADSMFIDGIQSPQNSIRTPSLFSSRTRKRYRNNRPSESDVHQHTLSMLYSAQHAPLPENQSPSPVSQPAPFTARPESHNQQSSLHAFWAIPSGRHTSPLINLSSASNNTLHSSSNQNSFQPTSCDDCDGPLNGDGDVDMMDIDSGASEDHACSTCGKHVCHSCSITNLGADRKCLVCAGRRQKWVGGLGWVDVL